MDTIELQAAPKESEFNFIKGSTDKKTASRTPKCQKIDMKSKT